MKTLERFVKKIYPFNRLLQQRDMHLKQIALLHEPLDAYRLAQDDAPSDDAAAPSSPPLDLAGMQRMLLR